MHNHELVLGIPFWVWNLAVSSYLSGAWFTAIWGDTSWRRLAIAAIWPIYWPAYLLSWPARKAWKWWRGRKVLALLTVPASIFAPTGTVLKYEVRCFGPGEPFKPDKPIAPGTPYGSKVDEAGRAVTVAEHEKLAKTTGEAIMWHQDWLAGLTDRIAALEAAQKPTTNSVIKPDHLVVGEDEPGVLIDGARWRGFVGPTGSLLYLCRDGREVAYMMARWACALNPWSADAFIRTKHTELSPNETRALVGEAKKAGVV